MCQGIALSLFKFSNKSVILTGIGSHSNLVKDNIDLLKKMGWKEGAGESVISVESNFNNNKYNQFTIELGLPDSSDLKKITSTYKKVGGSPQKIINHIKRCKKIDEDLLNLLTAPAGKLYKETTAPAGKLYEETTAHAGKLYDETTAHAGKLYEEKKAPAWKLYNETTAPAGKLYKETKAHAGKLYDETKAHAWKLYEETTAPAGKLYEETTAHAWKLYEETIAHAGKLYEETKAHAFIKLFSQKQNRIF